MHQPRTLTAAEEMRLAAGFVVQPFVAAVMAFVGFPLLMLGRLESGSYDPARSAISVALGTFMVAIGITLVLVVPLAIRVVKRRVLPFRRALLYGLAIGNLPVAIGGASSGFTEPGAAVGAVGFASLIGVTGAAVFWAISIRGRDFSRDPD